MKRPTLQHAALILTICIGITVPLAAADYISPSEMDAAKVYGFSCASCHGVDGGGLDPDNPLYKSFEAAPADFSDALFNSREPASDWAIVIKHGGARIGLSDEMPAWGDQFDDEQINALVTHLKGLVDTSRYPPGALNFRRGISTIKAFPEDEALFLTRYIDGDNGARNSFRSTLYYGRRLGARHQAEVKVAHINSGGTSELDEAEIGWKWAVSDNIDKQSIFSVGLEAAFPIADDEASEELIPYFSFAKGLSEEITFQGMLKAKLPVDDTDEGEATLSGILHWMRTPWPRGVFPALEATLTNPISGGDIESTVIPQLYFGLSKLGHVAMAVGVEIPVTDLDYEYRVHAFLLWDLADGSIFSGW